MLSGFHPPSSCQVRAKEEQAMELLAAEKALRAQLTLYTGRFEEFQVQRNKA